MSGTQLVYGDGWEDIKVSVVMIIIVWFSPVIVVLKRIKNSRLLVIKLIIIQILQRNASKVA